MLKKFFVAAIMSVLVVVGQVNLCDAMLYSEMYLGGLTVGSTVEYMKKLYGKPTEPFVGVHGHYEYGDSVIIHHDVIEERLYGIIVKANNGWATPAGLTVGMNISTALDLYGNPDYTEKGSYKTAYCYFYKVQKHSLEGLCDDVAFVILFNNSSGKILQLSIHGGDWHRHYSFMDGYQDKLKEMVQ